MSLKLNWTKLKYVEIQRCYYDHCRTDLGFCDWGRQETAKLTHALGLVIQQQFVVKELAPQSQNS